MTIFFAVLLASQSAAEASTSLGTFSLLSESSTSGNQLSLPYQGSSQGEGLNLYWSGSNSWQEFEVLSVGNSQYEIIESSGGRCLTVSGSGVAIDSCTGASGQLFSLAIQSDKSYVIKSSSGLCVSASGAFAATTAVACSTTATSQRWDFTGNTPLTLPTPSPTPTATTTPSPTPTATAKPTPTPTPTTTPVAGSDLGTFGLLIESASSGNQLSLPYQSSSQGEGLTTYWGGSSSWQEFKVISMGSSQYEFMETSGSRCITVSGSVVAIDSCVGSSSQLFNLSPQSDGSYVIESEGGDCLSASGAFTSATAAECMATSTSQRWKFTGSTPLNLGVAPSPTPTPTVTSTPTPTPTSSSTLPALPTWTTGAMNPAEVEKQVTVNLASTPVTVAPPGAVINVGANFNASSPLAENDTLNLYLVNASDTTVATASNNLYNGLTIMQTSAWSGPLGIVTSLTIPSVANGTYYIMLALDNTTGPIQLTPGTGVTQDNQYRYYIGAVTVNSSASAPTLDAPVTLNLTGYTKTFDDEFTTLSLSDSSTYNGSNWYTLNEECCMQSSDGAGTAMVGLSSPEDPYSLVSGGGLDIRLQEISDNWTSGVMTSVDSKGVGFSQQYGYFEMSAIFPSGLDTWPAFWLLNTAQKTGAPDSVGEIDIVEYIANPGFADYFATTLHDWTAGTTPAMSHNAVSPNPDDGNFHRYGMLWTAKTMTFYYDGAMTFQTPTPAAMNQPYYLLVDLGIGAGWPTHTTPAVNNMLVQYVRAYSLP